MGRFVLKQLIHSLISFSFNSFHSVVIDSAKWNLVVPRFEMKLVIKRNRFQLIQSWNESFLLLSFRDALKNGRRLAFFFFVQVSRWFAKIPDIEDLQRSLRVVCIEIQRPMAALPVRLISRFSPQKRSINRTKTKNSPQKQQQRQIHIPFRSISNISTVKWN